MTKYHSREERAAAKNAQKAAWRKANPEAAKAKDHAKYLRRRDKTLAQQKTYRDAHAEQVRSQKKTYYEHNRDEISARRKEKYTGHDEKEKAARRAYYDANKEKLRAAYKQYHLANRERVLARKAARRHSTRQNTPWRAFLRSARWSAQNKGLEFDLTEAWAAARWTGHCEMSGIAFDLSRPEGKRGILALAPSIDRIDSTKGYTRNNCRFVLFCVNALKNVGTDDDVFRIALGIVNTLRPVLPMVS
jgi:hypothetical protein